MDMRWLVLLLALAAPAAAEPGAAVAPIEAIVVHVQTDIADRRFLPFLIERLRRDLAPRLFVLDSELDMATAPRRGGKLDAEALVAGIAGSLDPVKERRAITVVLVAQDMRGPVTRFNFAYSLGGADQDRRVVVVSLARLGAPVPDLVAARVARMVVKNVARTAGYTGSEACVLGFARSLEDLDATPETFCEPDRNRLVRAGLVRP